MVATSSAISKPTEIRMQPEATPIYIIRGCLKIDLRWPLFVSSQIEVIFSQKRSL